MAWRAAWGVLALGAVLASPLVGAQWPDPTVPSEVAVSAGPIDGAVVPTGPFRIVPIDIQYTVMEIGGTFSATLVELEVRDAPTWAIVTMSPSAVFFPMDTPCGCRHTQTAKSSLAVSVTPDAPAFTTGKVVVAAHAHQNGRYAPSDGSAEASVPVAFYGFLNLSLQPKELRARGAGTWDVTMEVANYGNGAARVAFDPTGAPYGVHLQAPERLELAVNGTVAVTWHLVLDGDFAEGKAMLRATSVSAERPDVLGAEVIGVLEVLRESSLPAAEGVSVAAAFLAVAWASRRRAA